MLESSKNYSIDEISFNVRLASIAGLLTAIYSYYVKIKYNKDPGNYKALCDFNEHMSCSRVVASKYGKGFGIVAKLFGDTSPLNISNSILGSIFYILQFALSKF
jgi:vitamin-K-epoxide reductase (warfarin-sensitive)